MRRDHVRKARRQLGLSALALSELTGIGEDKIFQVERGRYLPTRAEAEAWASVLRQDPEALFPELYRGAI